MLGKPLSQDEVLQVCMAELEDARTFTSPIQIERQEALKAYNQEKYGDEQEGQSQYVASDVRDTIESILPDIVEIFVAGDAPVEFEPVDEQDIEAAEIETDAVRYVYLQQNDGFVNTYTAVKDALLSKNPYWYVNYETDYTVSREEYQGLSIEQITLLAQDPDIEIAAQSSTPVMGVDPMTGQNVMVGETYDVLVRRKREAGKVCVYPLPPERVYVSRFHNSVDLQDARCVIYEEPVMAGDLIQQGYDPALVDQIPEYQWFSRTEELTRWRKEGGQIGRDNPGIDRSRRIVQVLNCYIRIDEDGDGYPELRLVRIGSDSAKVILEDREIDRIPIVSGAIIMNPHKHYGNSIADLLQDIQQIRTSLMRQALNNTYFNNFPVTYVEENAANENTFQDLLSRRPAGFVRVNSIAGVRTEPPAMMGAESIQMLNLLDLVREDRVGMSRQTNGLDPNAISNATNLVGMTILSRGQARIKMMARVFAETGFKKLMLAIHELLMKHGSPFPMRRRDAFKMVNPREWKRRERMIVKVGTGFSSRMEKMGTAEAVLGKIEKVWTMGGAGRMVGEATAYNGLRDWCDAAGVDAGRYFTDPSQLPPPQPPKPSAQEQAVMVANKEAEARIMKQAADAKLEEQRLSDELTFKREQLASQHYLKAKELELKYGGNVDEMVADGIKPDEEQMGATQGSV